MKYVDHLIKSMEYLAEDKRTIFIGQSVAYSGNSIYNTLKTDSENALNGTSCLNTIALTKGAKILRVHDVKEAKECIILYEKTINSLI